MDFSKTRTQSTPIANMQVRDKFGRLLNQTNPLDQLLLAKSLMQKGLAGLSWDRLRKENGGWGGIERSSTSCARTHFPIPSFSWVHRWVHQMQEFNIFLDLESANCLLNLAASLAVAFDCNGPAADIHE
jgi:hypothetical protein